jgi:mRNA interferase RelE/StbE
LNRREEWRRRAQADLQEIARRDVGVVRRITEAVARYVEHDQGDVRRLTGQAGMSRLRVGDWRVLFTLEDQGQTVLILRVLNRRDAYR